MRVRIRVRVRVRLTPTLTLTLTLTRYVYDHYDELGGKQVVLSGSTVEP